jgi:hypothetical protein
LKTWFGGRLARYLSSEPPKTIAPEALADLERVARCLQPGDVILVEGNSRFSTGIKFLTQSTWSHAALYVGEAALAGRPEAQLPDGRRACVIEADLVDGVRAVGLDLYAGLPLRICRAVSLSRADAERVCQHAIARLGHRYDLKHIFDLMRWLMPAPPIPARFRRRLLTLGSGDPTRAICSMLVAEALQSVRYPILPRVERVRRVDNPDAQFVEFVDQPDPASEILHLRHASLFVPRDFDLSPYFEIVKPTLTRGFDHRHLLWGDHLLDADELAATVHMDGDGHAALPADAAAMTRASHATDVTDIEPVTRAGHTRAAPRGPELERPDEADRAPATDSPQGSGTDPAEAANVTAKPGSGWLARLRGR